MADGRLKIGSDFLKIGSLYLRIGPAPAGVTILAADINSIANPLSPVTLQVVGDLDDFDSTPDMWVLGIFVDVGAISSVAFWPGGAATGVITHLVSSGGYHFYQVDVTAYDAGEFAIDVTSVAAASLGGGLMAVFGGVTIVQNGAPAFTNPFVDGSCGIQIYAGQAPMPDPANGWRTDVGAGFGAIAVGMSDTSGGGSFSAPGGDLWMTTHQGQPSGTANAVGLALEIGL